MARNRWFDKGTANKGRPSSGRGFFRPCLERLEERVAPAIFVVTTTTDSGPGSLRQAILDSNANPGLDTIDFNIAPGGVQTIKPLSVLPSLDRPCSRRPPRRPCRGACGIPRKHRFLLRFSSQIALGLVAGSAEMTSRSAPATEPTRRRDDSSTARANGGSATALRGDTWYCHTLPPKLPESSSSHSMPGSVASQSPPRPRCREYGNYHVPIEELCHASCSLDRPLGNENVSPWASRRWLRPAAHIEAEARTTRRSSRSNRDWL
jgi:hypothetical protein